MKVTQKELIELFGVTKLQAGYIQMLIKPTFNSWKYGEKVLQEIDEILHNFGVESISNDDFSYRRGGDSVLFYINTGDSYNITFCYNTHTERFIITTVGDFIERYGEKYNIN